MKGQKYIAAAAILALLGGGGWWYLTKAKSAAAQNQVRYVEAPVKRGQIQASISGSGPVAAIHGMNVKTSQSGSVTEVKAKNGDTVKAGQVVMVLSNPTLQASLTQAQNDVQVAQSNLDSLLNPSAAATAPTQGGARQGSSTPSEEQIRQAQQKLDSAKSTLANREQDVANLQVTAPLAGQISGLTTLVGDNVSQNQQVFRVADYSAMQVTISVDELDIAKVKVDQKAEITLDAVSDKKYTGKVTNVDPEGNFKNDIATFNVTVALDSAEGLMAGMNANVSVVVDEKNDVLWVPAQAVQTRQEKTYVQQLVNNQPVAKEVQIGLKTSQQVEIVSGLNEGDKVIVTTIKPTTTSSSGLFGQRTGSSSGSTSGMGGTFGGSTGGTRNIRSATGGSNSSGNNAAGSNGNNNGGSAQNGAGSGGNGGTGSRQGSGNQ